MNKITLSAAALLGLALTSAQAAPVISAQSIIVNPVQPDLSVSVRVDKDATGQALPSYRIGEGLRISTTTNRDAYVYLFSVDSSGEVTQILPNNLGGDNFVKANTTKVFPEAGANFTFSVGGPTGLNKVLALASLEKLDLAALSRFESSQSQFATVQAGNQQQLAQALSIVVNPIPQNSWVTDTVYFDAVAQTPVRTGSLFVGTNVAGASVILNGKTLGSANVTYRDIAPGTYPIKVRASGYADFASTVTIKSGYTTNLPVDFGLRPAPAPVRPAPVVPAPVRPAPAAQYTLTINSTVNGARVFVNGVEAGAIRGGTLSVPVRAGAAEVVILAPGMKTYVGNYDVQRSATIVVNPR
ncbi:DUF4384 domain-containing protein [Deinococcus lacus]|uniref:DUF4384 domain-containing protein n=1 Tax=Deinococcus lacus TaxID=392561 RepID=A0ABW1YA49_9DEIO